MAAISEDSPYRTLTSIPVSAVNIAIRGAIKSSARPEYKVMASEDPALVFDGCGFELVSLAQPERVRTKPRDAATMALGENIYLLFRLFMQPTGCINNFVTKR